MKYELKLTEVRIGAFKLSIDTLKDLDKTIDDLCASLEHNDQKNQILEDLCPYFGVVWPSALALSKYFLKNEKFWKNQNVLELGCGLAIPSFVLKSLGSNITATDFHPDVNFFLDRNQSINDLHFPYYLLNWRELSTTFPQFDFVIGSDILYEGKHTYEVPNALIRFLKPSGSIIIADPGRGHLQQFSLEMKKLGLKEKIEIINVDKTEIFILEYKY